MTNTTFTSEVSLGSAPSNFNIHRFRHMLHRDAAAADDDYGEDEGYYIRLTYLLMSRRRIKGPKQTPLRSPQCFFFKTAEAKYPDYCKCLLLLKQ